MKYPEFNNIIINNLLGVSPTGNDTLLIAQQAANIEANNVIEVGTGNGFIPIYLATLGRKCEGIDINEQAINCASENAKINNIKIKFYLSDLLNQVNNYFDLVIFNPPYGNTGSTVLTKYLETIKFLLPKENIYFSNFVYFFIKKNRRKLISRFLEEVKSILTEYGKILILLHNTELDLIEGTNFNLMAEIGSQKLVLINSSQGVTERLKV